MPLDLKNRWTSYWGPAEPLCCAIWALSAVILAAFRTQGLRAWLGFSTWLDMAFVLWYQTLNDHFHRMESGSSLPRLVSQASGTVLELGPALGNQLSRFDASKIDCVYGIEPNEFFCEALEKPVAAANAAADAPKLTYHVVRCGIEDSDILEEHGITGGSIDSIVCAQVLCSVADPAAVARELYRLLRPGGKLIFWEHHGSGDTVTRVVQGLWNPIWCFLVGGCRLNRDMRGILKGAGEWENWEAIEEEGEAWSMLPHISGVLVKKI